MKLTLEDAMAETHVTLSAQERENLVRLLEEALKETRVEEHRTRTPSFRELVKEKEDVIVTVLGKLGRPVS
jgi:hypothetical protein